MTTKPSSLVSLASTNKSLEEKVTALNQVLELNPENIVARQELYETMQKLLRKDAFLAYEGETDVSYEIRTFEDFQFIHPKDRAVVELFPSQNPLPTREAINWLGWSVVGLIPAGLGTLVTAPLAMRAGFKLLNQPVKLMDRRRTWVVISCAIVLWLIALVFFFILILHLV